MLTLLSSFGFATKLSQCPSATGMKTGHQISSVTLGLVYPGKTMQNNQLLLLAILLYMAFIMAFAKS